jgi:NitT/TauT family transport system ATP-binding protein
MTALTVDIERKAYPGARPGGVVALEGLRFRAAPNEFLCILGPSGCGKTTMLNLIAGLDREFTGRVAFGDGSNGNVPRLAYVFQTPRLLPWRTVMENVALAAGRDADAIAKSRALIGEVGLAGFEDAFPGQLSLGMQRRAALARAFAVEPALLLMDEPFTSLDEATAAKLRMLLLKLWREHPSTVLFVTHDSREAVQLGQRLLLLTPSPARLRAELAVTLTQEQRADPAAVEAFRAERLGRLAEPRAPDSAAQYNGGMTRVFRP